MSETEEIVDSIGKIADLAVKRSVAKAEASFEAFRQKADQQIEDLIQKRPTLHVTINHGDPIQLTTKPSPMLPRLITNAKIGLHTMLVGPAGCGKTTIAHQVAESLKLQFGSVCLTAGASETWLFGRQTPNGFIEGAFSKIYREGGVFLADEMDAADANLLLSINTALSHDQLLNPMNGEMIKRSDNFVFIGAANTNGKGATHMYTGRSRLDAATLDRMVIINVDYDSNLERQLCPDDFLFDFLGAVREGLKGAGFDEFVSTRAFISCYKQKQAGVEMSDIKSSLCANWGEGAKKILDEKYKEMSMSIPGQPRQRVKKSKGAAVPEIFDPSKPPVPYMPGEATVTFTAQEAAAAIKAASAGFRGTPF